MALGDFVGFFISRPAFDKGSALGRVSADNLERGILVVDKITESICGEVFFDCVSEQSSAVDGYFGVVGRSGKVHLCFTCAKVFLCGICMVSGLYPKTVAE